MNDSLHVWLVGRNIKLKFYECKINEKEKNMFKIELKNENIQLNILCNNIKIIKL